MRLSVARGRGAVRHGAIRVAAMMLVLALAPARAETVDDFTAAVPGVRARTGSSCCGRRSRPSLSGPATRRSCAAGLLCGRSRKTALLPTNARILELRSIDFSEARISGERRLIVGVTTDGDSCAAPLALFEAEGDGKLLDMADVKQDRNYGFGYDFARSLGPDGTLVVVTNFHINSGEGYDTETLVLATADRLTPIGSVFAKSEQGCRRRISQDATIGIAPDYGPFARVTGYVKTATQRLAPDCQTPRGKEMIVITRTDWRWNAARRAYTKVAR